MENKIALLERRIERERKARKEAEKILEEKALELYRANVELLNLNESLEKEVVLRTKALKESKSRYEQLVEEGTEIIFKADAFGNFLYANPAAIRTFQTSSEEIFNINFFDLVDTSYQERIKYFIQNCIDNEIGSTYYEYPIACNKCNADELVWLGQNTHIDFIYDEMGNKKVTIRATARNITDVHNAQLGLKLSEEKYRRIMENMELGFLEVSLDGLIVRAYERFCKMTGYTEDELIGKNAQSILLPNEFIELMNEQEATRKDGEVGSYEVQIIKKNGERIWVLISGGPVFDDKGKVVGSVGIHYDISEQKRVQKELSEAKQAAEAAQKAEQEFLANMSHEIRTPLNAIIGMAHLLYDTRPTPEQVSYLEMIKNSANFLHTLISDVLDMAKIESGKIEVKKQEFDLVGLLKTIQKTFELKIDKRNVKIELRIDPMIQYMMKGDEVLLNQILLNLVGNAEKFTEEGTIGIRAKVIKKNGKNAVLEFKVFDTGIGMDEEKQKLIFQKFKQIHDKSSPKTKGTGLGLSIVKELVELQNGNIYVRSKKNKGTTFTFTIPLEFTNKKIAMNAIEFERNISIDSTDGLMGYSVLVAEDNLMNTKYVNTLLDKWKANAIVASDGKAAVEIANRERFDIILMDIQMPNMDGYEAAIHIRNTINPNQNTPIIALTASAMASEKNKAMEVGMNDVLTKPFTPNQLENILKNYLQKIEIVSMKASNNETKMVIDQQKLDEMYGDDVDFKKVVFETFIESIESQVVEMQEQFDEKNWVELGKTAHKIKPSFGMVGLSELELDLKNIETAIKSEGISEPIINKANNFLVNFPTYFNLVKEELDKMD